MASSESEVSPVSNEIAIPATEVEQQNLCDRCRSIDLDAIARGSSKAEIWVSSLESGCGYCDNFRMIVSECASGSKTCTVESFKIRNEKQKNIVLTCVVQRGRDYQWVLYDLIPVEQQRKEYRRTTRSCRDDEAAIFSLVQSSLETCRTSHSDCQRKKSGIFNPLKVIDCQSRTLCTIDSEAPYAALSYVWGNVPAEPLLNPQVHPLPKTIENVLAVCLRLGIQYLWVDRYCIDQENAQEKHTLISRMDQIYLGAELTIIAVAGENPNHGLAGVDGTPRHCRKEFRTTNSSYIASRFPDRQIASSTWSQRGWTYQEVLLSRRRLYFTDWEVIFECRSMRVQESVSRELEFSKYDGPYDGPIYSWPESDQPFYAIYQRISEYVDLRLTYSEDAIRGIEAILRSFRFTYSPEWRFGASEGRQTIKHFYGIPCTSRKQSRNLSFLISLLWEAHDFRISMENAQIFPSWSWAMIKTSTQGGMKFPTRVYSMGKEEAWTPSITLSHTIRGEESLLEFGAEDDYTLYHPWFQIDTWLLTGRSQQPVAAPSNFSFDKARYDETLKTDRIVAVNLITQSPRQGFLLVEQTTTSGFRRLGVLILHTDLEKDLNPSMALVQAAALKRVQNIAPDMEWELQERTVRLV